MFLPCDRGLPTTRKALYPKRQPTDHHTWPTDGTSCVHPQPMQLSRLHPSITRTFLTLAAAVP